jgi:integrase/recombinase XerD
MNQLRKAVRDYLTMRRGLGFKLVRNMRPDCTSSCHSWRENAVHASPLTWHWSGPRKMPITNPTSGRRGSASCAASPGTGVRRIPRQKFRHSVCCPTARRALSPYFYSDHEIQTLLKAAKTRPSIDPLRPWTYHCLFGLLAVTGLRLGEALNLRTGIWIGPKAFSRFEGPSSESPVWYRCMPRLVRSWPIMRNAGTSALARAPKDISW